MKMKLREASLLMARERSKSTEKTTVDIVTKIRKFVDVAISALFREETIKSNGSDSHFSSLNDLFDRFVSLSWGIPSISHFIIHFYK